MYNWSPRWEREEKNQVEELLENIMAEFLYKISERHQTTDLRSSEKRRINTKFINSLPSHPPLSKTKQKNECCFFFPHVKYSLYLHIITKL